MLDCAIAARAVLELVDERDRNDFMSDRRTQLAVMYQLVALGEAVKRLSPEIRGQHPTVPWRRLGGMRDKLVHGYDAINPERVWTTVREEIPNILAEIEKIERAEAKRG